MNCVVQSFCGIQHKSISLKSVQQWHKMLSLYMEGEPQRVLLTIIFHFGQIRPVKELVFPALQTFAYLLGCGIQINLVIFVQSLRQYL